MRAPPKPAIRNQARIPASGSLLRFSPPVIPAKAGIQTIATKPAIRNQVQTAVSGSLLPSWEKARMRVPPRASAALRAGTPALPEREPIPASPSCEKARMRAPPPASAAYAGETPDLPETPTLYARGQDGTV